MAKTYEEIMELVGKTVEITKSNSENTAVILDKLDQQERLLGGLSKTVGRINVKNI